MGFCNRCGEIVKAGTTSCAKCGGRAKEATASGFSDSGIVQSPATLATTGPTFKSHESLIVSNSTPANNASASNVEARPQALPPVAPRPKSGQTGAHQGASPAATGPPVHAPKPTSWSPPTTRRLEPSLASRAPGPHDKYGPPGHDKPSQPHQQMKLAQPPRQTLRCTMCFVELDSDRAKRAPENPQDAYCIGCWNVRPVPGKPGTHMDDARRILEMQAGKGSPNPCAACSKPMGTATAIFALGVEYHEECFCCEKCRQPLAENFVNHQGKPWCMSCHRAKLYQNATSLVTGTTNSIGQDVCAQCKLPIFSNVISLSDGKKYCQDCWVCAKCKWPLESMQVALENGQIIHPGCVTRSCCARCGMPFDGAFVQKNGQKIHSSCFRCSICQAELAGQPFGHIGGKETCAKCLKNKDSRI